MQRTSWRKREAADLLERTWNTSHFHLLSTPVLLNHLLNVLLFGIPALCGLFILFGLIIRLLHVVFRLLPGM